MRGYDSHLIFCELNKFDVKINVTPNGLEKYMAFFWVKNLVFIDSMQFMNSSLNKLVKNLSDENFKYLVKEIGSKNLELLKQRCAYPYEYMNSFEKFEEKELPNKECFFSLTKKEKISDDGEILDSHIGEQNYLTRENIWNIFDMKDMGNYHDHYLKK